MGRIAPPGRHVGALTASYAALVAIAFAAVRSYDVHFGALAVIPLLYIAYYAPVWVSILTALASGAALAAYDREPVISGGRVAMPAVFDGLILCASLCAVVVISRRLRASSNANELLNLHLLHARRIAAHDALTGVANRSAFMQALGEACASSSPQQRTAVFFCDLDGFKLVNDTHGHNAGDAILRMASSRLSHAVRANDLVGRIGGDEFGILARDVHDAGEAARMAANIERAFHGPFRSGDASYYVGITVGFSICPDDARAPDALLRLADESMYNAKQAKRVARAARSSEA